jgi:hypothetical protein
VQPSRFSISLTGPGSLGGRLHTFKGVIRSHSLLVNNILVQVELERVELTFSHNSCA